MHVFSYQSKEEFSDSFCSFDESKNPADSEDSDDSEKRRRDREVLHHVLHDNTDDGSDDEYEVEDVPADREVLESKPDDLHQTF